MRIKTGNRVYVAHPIFFRGAEARFLIDVFSGIKFWLSLKKARDEKLKYRYPLQNVEVLKVLVDCFFEKYPDAKEVVLRELDLFNEEWANRKDVKEFFDEELTRALKKEFVK